MNFPYKISIDADSDWLFFIAKNFFNKDMRIRFYRKIAALTRNGKRLQASLENLQKRAERKAKTDIEAIVLRRINTRIKNGDSFAKSLEGLCPIDELMVIQAGEEAGTLPDSLTLVVELIQASKKMKSSVISALAQPLFLFLLLIGAIFFIGYYVVPKLEMILPSSKWVGAAKSLAALSVFVQSSYFLMSFFLILFLNILFVLSLPRWTGRLRTYADRIPPWSFYRLMLGSGWLLSLAALIKSGTSLYDALKEMHLFTKKNKNRWLYERLKKTLFYLNNGHNFGDALDKTKTSFPDQEVIDDLMTYSDLPNFEDILYTLGKEWVEEGLISIEKQSSVLKQFCIVLIGGAIGWFAYAVMTIQQLMSQSFF